MDKNIVIKVRKALKSASDPQTKAAFLRYFKSDENIKFHGVKSGAVIDIAKKYWQEIKTLDKDKVWNYCENLLKSEYCEEAWIAANWTHWHDNFTPGDFPIFESWINKYINNWAECDTFCNHSVGDLIIKYPKYLKSLKRWAKSKNLWMRRASAVSLIVPARRGDFLPDIFDIADILLEDKEDMVQKGYGWMLKEASRKHQKEVFNYVLKNKAKMPRTALRYAIEKMPDKLRKKAMKRD